ncbi:MAG: hypothetical protein KIT07_07550 [Anaerolineales bacterium]|nr:hypothetical protein [Anaerolineales bacterium]
MRTIIAMSLVALLLASCVAKSDLEAANKELESLHQRVESLVQENEQLKSTNLSIGKQLTDAQTELRSTRQELENLLCEQQITDMKYSNVLDASTIIAAWWATQSNVASTHGTYRDHIWSNADTKIHAVRFTSSVDQQQYVEHFLIYFSEFGMKPGVFWVGGQCWLDAP